MLWIRSADSLEVELSDRVRRHSGEPLMHLDHVFIEIETAVDNQVRIGAPELTEVASELMTALRPALERTMLGVIQEAAAEISAQLVGQSVEVRLSEGEPSLVVTEERVTPHGSTGGIRGEGHLAVAQLAEVADRGVGGLGGGLDEWLGRRRTPDPCRASHLRSPCRGDIRAVIEQSFDVGNAPRFVAVVGSGSIELIEGESDTIILRLESSREDDVHNHPERRHRHRPPPTWQRRPGVPRGEHQDPGRGSANDHRQDLGRFCGDQRRGHASPMPLSTPRLVMSH